MVLGLRAVWLHTNAKNSRKWPDSPVQVVFEFPLKINKNISLDCLSLEENFGDFIIKNEQGMQ